MSSNQPKKSDIVLGNQSRASASAVVLGGLEGVQRRLSIEIFEHKIAALPEALNYGEEGLTLVIEALNDPADQIKELAHDLLKNRTELKVKVALREYLQRWYPIRYDGLYKTDNIYDEKRKLEYCKYLRFYPDGTLLTKSTNASVEQVAKLLCKDNFIQIDTYKVFNKDIKISTEKFYCATDCWGKIHMHGNTISLNRYDHYITNRRSSKDDFADAYEDYHFIKLSNVET
ncbi:hypothetical protein CAL7716_008760 [Calothrix sp. PCC 7716]|nr:hypothetical protein CAL7716_008760 [Calothrix sp. PCC 7716]